MNLDSFIEVLLAAIAGATALGSELALATESAFSGAAVATTGAVFLNAFKMRRPSLRPEHTNVVPISTVPIRATRFFVDEFVLGDGWFVFVFVFVKLVILDIPGSFMIYLFGLFGLKEQVI